MTTLGGLVLILSLIGGTSFLIAMSQLWMVDRDPDAPVGPWTSPRPAPSDPTPVPHDFRSLIWGEQRGWFDTAQWQQLVNRLNEMERELGGEASNAHAPPAPPEYSHAWLEGRLQTIESLAGPMPAPWTEPPRPARKKWISI